jgi:small-conductance mechanosensitive channel
MGNWFAGQTIKKLSPFRIGDWIRASDVYGRVVKIDDLYTTLVTSGNESVIIPNGKLTSDVIVDRTANGSINVPVEVDVPSRVELSALTSALSNLAREVASSFTDIGDKESPEIHILSQTPGTVRIRVTLRVSNPAREEEAKSELRKRVAELQWPDRIRSST